jgi:hypothetical protein
MNPTTQAWVAQIDATKTVIGSATVLITGIAARIQAAIDAAIAGGATADDLAPVQTEVDLLTSDTAALSAAVVANTPAAPTASAKRS